MYVYHVLVMYAHDWCLLPYSAISNHQIIHQKLKSCFIGWVWFGFQPQLYTQAFIFSHYTSHNSTCNTIVGAHVLGITLPETNTFAPEKRPPQKETSSSNHWFSGAFAVSFREGTYSSWWFQPILKICLPNWIISPNRDENQNCLHQTTNRKITNYNISVKLIHGLSQFQQIGETNG